MMTRRNRLSRLKLSILRGGVRRRRICLAALLAGALFMTPSVHAAHVPADPDETLEFEGFTRLFVDLDRFEPNLELLGRWKNDGQAELDYHAMSVGSYFRVIDNLKVGAFYQLQAGARHDDDWVELSDGGWEWKDSSSRYEQLFTLDASPRFLLEFLPGRSWVFMLKSRYHANVTSGLHSLMFRPGLTYFWLQKRQPVLNISAAYAFYVPLNFSELPIYQHWPYLELLYHVSDQIKLDARFSRRSITWTDSKDFQELHPDGSYEVTYTPISIGLGVIFSIEP